MLFNSLKFLLFFPLVCVVYFLLPAGKWRNVFLLGASYFFYVNWQPAYALLLLASTLVTYLSALGIGRSSSRRTRKVWLIGGIVFNLLLLFFFKYYSFAGENITALLRLAGVEMQIPGLDILLPVGISFYTFQSLGYVIDVYRGQTAPERSLLVYALFVSFFPQLVAGPIERSGRLLPQFKTPHRFDGEKAVSGLKTMLWGYFLKLVVADRCAMYVDQVFSSLSDHPGHSTLIAAVLFCLQLYGDFAGYTYIAIGSARIMGFSLRENFRRPYLATSIRDFWRRWHISLTSWFTDYVYIPLGGNRCSAARHRGNILVTFLVSGLWHGANWTFVLWGGYHGVLQALSASTRRRKTLTERRSPFLTGLGIVATFFLVMVGWVFFRADSVADAFLALKRMADPADFSLQAGMDTLLYCAAGFLILVAKELCEEYGIRFRWAEKHPELADNLWMILLTIGILQLGVFDGGKFIYFQF